MSVMALTRADQLRELFPDGADGVLATAREATGFTDKALRTVTFLEGNALLVDADCEDTDDEIRESYLAADGDENEEDGEQEESI
jgi:hypothetical protein